MVRSAGAEVYTASVELSTKVLDSYNKLASTLCHELVCVVPASIFCAFPYQGYLLLST